MAGDRAGYVAGALLAFRIIRDVGRIRCFAAFGAMGGAASLAFVLIEHPLRMAHPART
jgi:hypothetical protein